MTDNQRTKSPCIGICSTTYGGAVCRGCKRFAHEVVDWNRYDEDQKTAVVDRLERLNINAVSTYIKVTNPEALKNRLDREVLRYNNDWSPESWALTLLWSGRAQNWQDLQDSGIEPLPEYSDESVFNVWQKMDEICYNLSLDYYQRYVKSKDSPEWG